MYQTLTINRKRDLSCIWMVAGVVNYKLCDRNFDCENCEFDRIMQGIVPNKKKCDDNIENSKSSPVESNEKISNWIQEYFSSLFTGCKFYLDHVYQSDYFWCQKEDDDCILIGLDKLVLKMVSPVDRLILPEAGDSFHKGQLMAWIFRKGKTIPLHAPISGEVTEINPEFIILGFEHVIENDKYLFKMMKKDISYQIQNKYSEMAGLQHYMKKVSLLKNLLQDSLQGLIPAEIGETLADGGNIQIDLEKIIGTKNFEKFLKQIFS
jgi:glycine cleavage system H lipoate-binding protein